MKIIRWLLCFVAVAFTLLAKAQPKAPMNFKVMHYNVLNYGLSDSACPGLITWQKHQYLRTILSKIQPDILALVKMSADSSFITDSVLHQVLDTVNLNAYNGVTPTARSGFYKANTLYYKQNRFGYAGTTILYSTDTLISDLICHNLYVRDSVALGLGDTTWLKLIQVHLLSGDTTASIRGDEIDHLLDSLQMVGNPNDNYLILGDFNSRKSTEPCLDHLFNPTDTAWRFYSPASLYGNWDSLPNSFAKYLTISSRTSSLDDCGSKGGLDEIYDHILANGSIMRGSHGISYVDSSYEVIGQDGMHVNKALTDKPKNSQYSGSFIKALYYMSNHLPVMVTLSTDTVSTYGGYITGTSPVCPGAVVELKANGYLGTPHWLYSKNGKWIPWGDSSNTLTVSPNRTMQFCIAATQVGTSDTSAPFTLEVKSKPTGIVFSDSSFCEGDSLELKAGSYGAYAWSNGSFDDHIYVHQPGTYWLTWNDGLNCTWVDSVNIYQRKKPSASFQTNVLSTPLSFQFWATDTQAVTWHWDFGDGYFGSGDTVTHTYASVGTDTVKLEVKSSFGCIAQSWQVIQVTTGIQEPAPTWENKWNLLAQSNREFNIIWDTAPLQTYEVSLLDVLGKVVWRVKGNPGQQQFQLPIPTAGTWYVRVASAAGSQTKGIVVF